MDLRELGDGKEYDNIWYMKLSNNKNTQIGLYISFSVIKEITRRVIESL